MMYRAARSLVASSVADENTSVVLSWREHYTGTNLFAFETFASALRGRSVSEARRRLMLRLWNACRELGERSSIPFPDQR
jgi:hypothetical protein